MTTASWLVRTAGALGVAWGALLLERGETTWGRVAGRPPTSADLVGVRVLGLRHLVQGAAQVAAPQRLRRLFVAVDVVHALTMLALAGADERRRRPAVLSAVVALASAATTTAAVCSTFRPTHEIWRDHPTT